jgi:hypothetical protein
MTDDETFTDILASFPFTLDQLRDLKARTAMLVDKTTAMYADKTLDAKSRRQLLALYRGLGELEFAADMIERDADPQDEDIPF